MSSHVVKIQHDIPQKIKRLEAENLVNSLKNYMHSTVSGMCIYFQALKQVMW